MPVELTHKDIEQQQAIEREHLRCLRTGDSTEPYGCDKHDSGHRIDGTHHLCMDVGVHECAEFPQCSCCHNGEEEEGTDRTIDGAADKQQYINGTGQGADDEATQVHSS